MRKATKEENTKLTGWNNGRTAKPISFMMASKFLPVVVGIKDGKHFLFTPLNQVQLEYLRALGVHPDIYTEMDIKPVGVRSG